MTAQNEAQLRLALEAARMGTFHWNISTGEIIWSDEYRKIFGHPSDLPATYDNWLVSLLPEERAITDQKIRAAMDCHDDFDAEYRILWPDGSVRWISGRGRFYYNADGLPQRMEGVVTDITDRKLEERLLARSEGWLHLALASAKAGAWEWDLRTDENCWSEELWELFGLDAYQEKPTFDLWSRTVHPDDRGAVEQRVRETARAGSDLRVEWRVNLPNDRLRWLSSCGRPVRDGGGIIASYIGIVTDITERKIAEDEIRELNLRLERKVEERTSQLRASEEMFRALVENITDCIWETDQQGRFTYLSPSIHDLTGYPPADFLGKTPLDILHLDVDAEQVRNDVMDLRNRYIPPVSERRIRHRDGRLVVLEVCTVPKISSHGDFLGLRGITRDITARTQAEEKLRISEENLRLAQRVAGIGSWYVDIERENVQRSEETARIIGQPQRTETNLSEALGLVHPDDREKVWGTWQSALVTGEPFIVEHRILVDGGIRWVREVAEFERNKEGRIVSSIGTSQDITDRKRYEAELQKASAYARSLIEVNLDPLVTIAPDGTISDVNRASILATGYSRVEMIGTDFCSYFTDSEKAREGYQRVFEKGIVRDYPLEIRHRDGHVTPVLYNASVYLDERGEVAGVFAAARDITERRRHEVEIKKYQDIIQSSDDAIISKTLDGIVTSWNPGAERIFGYGAAEMIGKPIADIFPQEVLNEEQDFLERIARGESVNHYVSRRIRKDGSPVDVSVMISPILDDAGHVIGASKIARDITDLMKHEHELEAARQAAEAANIAKSEFLANMSHEIRTPINVIMGMAQVLEYMELSQEQSECLDVILSSSQNLLSLVNDVLDLSRIESGKVELERRPFSLRASISEVIKSQLSLIHNKGLVLNIDIPSTVPDNLTGDQLRLKQILINFLSNAIKFTNRGRIRIDVSSNGRHDDVVLLKIGISDTGIGISHDDLEKIFAPFVQADASTTRRYGGTGLGLAICTRLAEVMGGKVWAESSVGEGSTFYLLVPVIVNEFIAERRTRRSGDKVTVSWNGPPLRILLADDQENNLLVTRMLLEKAGHTVVEARDGREALRQLEYGAFDLALMDIQMPGMSGIEATRAIRERERERGEHLPIIAVTARAMPEEQVAILNQGFDGYLAKPILADTLFAEMRKRLPASVLARAGNREFEHLPQPDEPASSSLSRDQLAELLKEIEALLRSHDTVMVVKSNAYLKNIPASEAVRCLEKHVKRFDFEEALSSLADIRNEHGIEN